MACALIAILFSFMAVEGTSAATATWTALTGQWVQWLEDSMPAECLPGNSGNEPGTPGFDGKFTKVPLTCCTNRSKEELLIFSNFPNWTVDNFPTEVCKDLSAFFGAPAGSSYNLAACDASGTSWYGEDCTSGDIATKCNCAKMAASTSQPACFRAGDVPDDMVIDANGTLAGKVRWFAYHAGCATEAHGTEAPTTADDWTALTGQWVQWSEDSMPAECLPGNSGNEPGTAGFDGAFTKVPLTCCTDRSEEDLLIFSNFPNWTIDNFPKEDVCKDLSAFFGAPAGSSYNLAACDAAGTSWYGERCTSGDIATNCNCAKMAASTSQPACFRAGDVPDDMVIDADGNLAGKVRWFAYLAGCATTTTTTMSMTTTKEAALASAGITASAGLVSLVSAVVMAALSA